MLLQDDLAVLETSQATVVHTLLVVVLFQLVEDVLDRVAMAHQHTNIALLRLLLVLSEHIYYSIAVWCSNLWKMYLFSGSGDQIQLHILL